MNFESMSSGKQVLAANLESLKNLRENLEANEINPAEIPMVLQFNKRDLPNALPIEILRNLPPACIVMDCVYNPLRTPLLKEAETTGLKTIDGLALFVGQASAQ